MAIAPPVDPDSVAFHARAALLGMALRSLAADTASQDVPVNRIRVEVTEIDTTHPGIEVTYLDVSGLPLLGHSL